MGYIGCSKHFCRWIYLSLEASYNSDEENSIRSLYNTNIAVRFQTAASSAVSSCS